MANTHSAADTQALKQIWSPEWGLDPVEETKIADWVEEPIGTQKFGNKLNLRKIPAIAAQTFSSTSTAGLRTNLTGHTAEATTVTADPAGRYCAIGIDRALANRCVDDGNLRAGYRKQGMAGLWTAMDVVGFALAANLSSTVSQADMDDAMVRTALGQLATNAGNIDSSPIEMLTSPTWPTSPFSLRNLAEAAWRPPTVRTSPRSASRFTT